MTTSDKDIRLLVTTEATNTWGDRYLKFEATVVEYTDNLEALYLDFGSYGSHLTRLGISGQIDPTHAENHGYAADFYGSGDVEFRDPYRLGMRDAEAAVKTLRRVDRHMARHAERFGAAADTTDRLVRLANAVGVKSKTPFLRRCDANAKAMFGTDHRPMNADDLRYWLRDTVRQWIDLNGLVAKVAS